MVMFCSNDLQQWQWNNNDSGDVLWQQTAMMTTQANNQGNCDDNELRATTVLQVKNTMTIAEQLEWSQQSDCNNDDGKNNNKTVETVDGKNESLNCDEEKDSFSQLKKM